MMTLYVLSTFATGLSVSITLNSNAACYGDCNGSATAVANGGTGTYSYVWSGPNGYTNTDSIAVNMCAGEYTVTATDSNDMSTATANVVITQPAAIYSTFTYTKSQCGSGSSTVNLTNTGSSGSEYSYSWTFDGGTPTSSTLENPSVFYNTIGNFNVTHTVTNNTCTSSTTETISIYNIYVNIFSSPSCYSYCSGTANSNVSGGVFPYTYLWSDSSTSSQISGLCPGSYSITVTDLYGCTGTNSVTIVQDSQLTVSFISNGLTCGNCNGTATCQVNGGTPPYNYTWSNFICGATINNLCIGTYWVTVLDAVGCSTTGMVGITTASSGFTYSATTTPETCNYHNGSICVPNPYY